MIDEPLVPPQDRSIERSVHLRDRAEELIPLGAQTFSKSPSQYVQGVAPVYLDRGSGSRVWDVDGNEYIDYPMAQGAVILGHDYSPVSEAVCDQMDDGSLLSLSHPLEVTVAELLTEHVPCAEMVRFGKNGSDATAGAVRLARAYTGRDIVACCGYHGWQDWYIATKPSRNMGVPGSTRELTKTFKYNDIGSLERIFENHSNNVAAVVMEPVVIEPPEDDFLQQVKEVTERNDALLIFDEVKTGFRFGLGGAQEYFDISPDIACVGKAMGNGLPISAIVGRREVMRLLEEVFFSFTYGGEILSLAASQAAIRELDETGALERIWEQGKRLRDGYNTLAREFGIDDHTECIGYPPRTVMKFGNESGEEALEMKSYFQQECLKRGILYVGAHNLSYSHSPDVIDETLRVYRTVMELLADAIVNDEVAARLEGPAIRPVFGDG